MKPVDAKSSTYIDSGKNNNKKDPKFNVGDNVSISKFENIFAKGYVPNWSKDFVITKLKNTVSWTYVISDLNGEEIAVTFYEKKLQKTSQKTNQIEKVIKRKGDRLYVKSNGNVMTVHLIVELIKKILVYKNEMQ